MKKEDFDEILTDVEKQKLSALAMDEEMLSALKKVLLYSVYHAGVVKKGVKQDPLQNAALIYANNPKVSDKEIADYLRALYQGLNAIELGFLDIAKYKLEKMPDLKNNPAR